MGILTTRQMKMKMNGEALGALQALIYSVKIPKMTFRRTRTWMKEKIMKKQVRAFTWYQNASWSDYILVEDDEFTSEITNKKQPEVVVFGGTSKSDHTIMSKSQMKAFMVRIFVSTLPHQFQTQPPLSHLRYPKSEKMRPQQGHQKTLQPPKMTMKKKGK